MIRKRGLRVLFLFFKACDLHLTSAFSGVRTVVVQAQEVAKKVDFSLHSHPRPRKGKMTDKHIPLVSVPGCHVADSALN